MILPGKDACFELRKTRLNRSFSAIFVHAERTVLLLESSDSLGVYTLWWPRSTRPRQLPCTRAATTLTATAGYASCVCGGSRITGLARE